MLWSMSEELLDYGSALRSWLADAASLEAARGWYDAHDPSPFEQRFVTDGWSGVGVAEELGGQGGGLAELAVTAEELARACAPSSHWLATVLALPALAGRAESQAALEGAGAALVVPAEVVPEETAGLPWADGVVTGVVPRVLGADRVRWLVVPVADAEGRRLVLVDAHGEAVRVVARRPLDRSRAIGDVHLDGAAGVVLAVDADLVLGRASVRAAVLLAADALGVSARMLELTVEYSKQRHQFGKPIASFQAVKHAAATILVGVEAARSVVPVAAAVVEAGGPDAARVAAAVTSQVTAEAVRTAESALTVHGAIGYTWEHDLHLYGKRARLTEQLFGSSDRWRERLADQLQLA
ncbi:acyl-CoA dehydrogenase [Geodermatophilaceae bacterium NBWT11]|nr:acyl-CoA dehydrogenase [Geodermatophilaceae bacterium NBWT11]